MGLLYQMLIPELRHIGKCQVSEKHWSHDDLINRAFYLFQQRELQGILRVQAYNNDYDEGGSLPHHSKTVPFRTPPSSLPNAVDD